MRSLNFRTTVAAAILGVIACRLPATAASDAAALRARITALHAEAVAHIEELKRHSDDPYDVVTRFDDAATSLDDARAASDPAYLDERTIRTDLDADVLKALEAGTEPPVATTPGVHETLVPSGAERKLQPVAMIIPRGYDGKRAVPMVVALHGMGETDTDVVSRRQLRELADRSGALVLAPYAHGDGQFGDAAIRDVSTAIDTAAGRWRIDIRRVYLLGYSNGGVAVFHVARAQPTRFAAICSIAGTLDGVDADGIAKGYHGAVYLIAGGRDTLLPSAYAKRAVAFLRSAGIPARYYEAASAGHDLNALAPAIAGAWGDMFSGMTQSQADNLGALPSENRYSPTYLPAAAPTRPQIPGV